jgi:hypothetical protein
MLFLPCWLYFGITLNILCMSRQNCLKRSSKLQNVVSMKQTYFNYWCLLFLLTFNLTCICKPWMNNTYIEMTPTKRSNCFMWMRSSLPNWPRCHFFLKRNLVFFFKCLYHSFTLIVVDIFLDFNVQSVSSHFQHLCFWLFTFICRQGLFFQFFFIFPFLVW